MLHLLEVPQHVRRHTHKELQIMEEYMQRHTQVAKNMAELMVRLTPGEVCRLPPQHQCREQISLPFPLQAKAAEKRGETSHPPVPTPATAAPPSEVRDISCTCAWAHTYVNIMPLSYTCAEDTMSHYRKMNASLRWSIRSWKLSTELNLAWDLESVCRSNIATLTDARML